MMPTATKGKRPLRHLTATDKCIAIQRIHDGESKASVARDIGVPESTLRGWCKNEEKLRYMSQQAQDQKPNADHLMDKIVSEAAMAAAAAAELLGGGPAEKRAKLDPAFLASMNGKGMKNDYHNLYKRNSLNGMDLSGHHNAADAYAYSYNSFAKAASNLSAMQNKQKDMKGYDLSLKHDDHGKSDLSMAAISPLTSLSNLSGMGALGQSPLALSFNDIATNLNLLAQLQSNSMASFGNSPGGNQHGGNGTPMRSSGPRSNPNNNNASCSPRSDIMDKHGNGPQSLTVKNLAKLQQRSPSLSANDLGMNLNLADSNNNSNSLHMGGNSKAAQSASKMNSNKVNGSAPAEDPLWYWLKSQQAMMGLNGLYSNLPRTSSPVASVRNSAPPPQASPTPPHPTTPSSTVPQPQNSGQSKASANQQQQQQNANFDYHLLNAMLPNSLSGLSDPKALTSSPFFWQWYKTVGANLLKGNNNQQQQPTSQISPTPPPPKNNNNHNHLPAVDANLNYLSPTGSNKTGGSSSSPYNNILFSQLTKSAAAAAVAAANNEAGKSEPEDLSHHHQQLLQHHLEQQQQQQRRDAMAHQLFNDEMEEDRRSNNRRPLSHPSAHEDDMDDEQQQQRRQERRKDEGNTNTHNNNPSDLSGTTNNTSNSDARHISSRTPSPSTVKCPGTTTNVLELMNPDASPLNSLLKPISVSDVAAPMSHSSAHSSSTNSTTMLTEAPCSPQSPREEDLEGEEEEEEEDRVAGDDTSNDSLHHLQQQIKSPGKVRAVLDNFLYNNINNNNNSEETGPRTTTTATGNGENVENEHNNNIDIRNNNNVPLMSSLEAFEYGEKFLKWLESCSDPSITAMQVMQFRYLLQSVKTSANRAANNNNTLLDNNNGGTGAGTGTGGYHHGGSGGVEFMAVKREIVGGMADERCKIRRRK